MKGRFFVILCFGCLFLAACGPTVWRHNQHSDPSRFEQDKRECHYDSIKHGQATGYYSSGVGAGIADGLRQNEVFNACMQARGYYQAK